MEDFIIKKKAYQVESALDDNHYVVNRKGKQYVFVDYSNDSDGLKEFKETYKKMKVTGICFPKVYVIDEKQSHGVLMDYIPGNTALDELVQGELTEDWYNGIFLQAKYAKTEKYALDFDPINFKLHDGKLYYLKFKLYPYDDSRAFQNVDVFRWVYSKQLVKELRERGLPVDRNRLRDEFTTNKETVLLVVQYYR